MLSLTLATWWEPGQGIPVWHYFGAELDHLPLLFLFIIFFVADAGKEWGLDGRARRGHRVQDEARISATSNVGCSIAANQLRRANQMRSQ